jgi:hypothetical protein
MAGPRVHVSKNRWAARSLSGELQIFWSAPLRPFETRAISVELVGCPVEIVITVSETVGSGEYTVLCSRNHDLFHGGSAAQRDAHRCGWAWTLTSPPVASGEQRREGGSLL